ncbi:MAG TPA: ABC transporter substrate-binding protein, partial [Allocoleopsis sp.]
MGRSKAIAAIGHEFSGVMLAASKAYEKYSMPVVSGSATADQLSDFNWFFRTVFANQDQATLIANYAKEVLNYSKVELIYTNDTYGQNLGEVASRTFRELGGRVSNEWSIKSPANAKEIQKIVGQLKVSIAENKPDALFAAISFDDTAEFIWQLKSAGINLPIIGGDTFADQDVIQQLEGKLQDKEKLSFFTSNILGVNPVIYGVLDDSGQQFKADFEGKFGREPGWAPAAFYDAGVAIVEALKQEDTDGKNTAELRAFLINKLKQFNSPSTAFEGAGRLIYFNELGNAASPAYIAQHDRQQIVSAFTQLQLVRDINSVPDLDQKLKGGEIVKIGDSYLQKAHIVFTGMDINALESIDEETSSYLIDFYLWFRYQGDIPADDIEFTNYSVERLDSGEELSLGEPVAVGQRDGANY